MEGQQAPGRAPTPSQVPSDTFDAFTLLNSFKDVFRLSEEDYMNMKEFTKVDARPSEEYFLCRALYWAASEGNAPLVEKLLQLGANTKTYQKSFPAQTQDPRKILAELPPGTALPAPPEPPSHACTPLAIAIENKHEDVVRTLIEHKVQIDTAPGKKSEIFSAVESGNLEILDLLLRNGANPNTTFNFKGRPRTLLSRAVEVGRPYMVSALLDAEGALSNLPNLHAGTEDGVYELAAANGAGNTRIMKILFDHDIKLTDEAGAIALGLAANQGHEEMVELLLTKVSKASINGELTIHGEKRTPLRAAVWEPKIVKMLLEAGAGASRNNQGFIATFLRRAEPWNEEEVLPMVKMMLQKGFHPDGMTAHRWTPLHAAAYKGFHEVVAVLLATRRVDVEARAFYRMTPLLIAAHEGNYEIVKLLLDHEDVNPSSRDIKERTALDLAYEIEHGPMVELLIERCPKLADRPRITSDVRWKLNAEFEDGSENRLHNL